MPDSHSIEKLNALKLNELLVFKFFFSLVLETGDCLHLVL